jgi:hypothetical protein
VWCVVCVGCALLYIGAGGGSLASRFREPTPHRLIALIAVGVREVGPNCSGEGTAASLACALGPATLQPSFTPPPLLWACIAVLVWAWPNCILSWPFSSSPSSALSRKHTFLLCSTCFRPFCCIPDNLRAQLETRYYHMYMCVLMFISSFLVECWR